MNYLDESFKNKRLTDTNGNRLMREKIQGAIKAQIDKLVMFYPGTSRDISKVYAEAIATANYTAEEVEKAILSFGNQAKMPSLPEVKGVLAQITGRATPQQQRKEKEWKGATHDREEYIRIKESFLEKFTQEDLDKWTKYYCKNVFGNEVLKLSYIRSFEQVALKDLVRSNMNKEKAIERGKGNN